MPIKGVSDVERLPRIGKVRLGIKKISGKKNAQGQDITYPEKTDYFVMDPDDDAILAEIEKIYSKNPKALDIMFATDDLEQVFPQYLKRYSYGTLVCKGDGVTATEVQFGKKMISGKEVTEKTGTVQRSCEGCQYAKDIITKEGKKIARRCKPLASLMILLPRVPGIGVWQLDTSSYHSIVGVNAGLRLVNQLYKRISGIPLKLLLKPRQVNAEGRAKTVYTLSLSIEGTLQAALKASASAPALVGKTTKALMPGPDEEHAEDHFPAGAEEQGVEEVVEITAATEEHDEPALDAEDVAAEFEGQIVDDKKPSALAKDAAVKLMQSQSKQLGYTSAQMSAYILSAFKKSSTKDMTQEEANTAVLHIGSVIDLIGDGVKTFTREEMEKYAKSVYKRTTMIEMTDSEIKQYGGYVKKATAKGEIK
jgi:hypothetical protein